jgi:hypothetical protein
MLARDMVLILKRKEEGSKKESEESKDQIS